MWSAERNLSLQNGRKSFGLALQCILIKRFLVFRGQFFRSRFDYIHVKNFNRFYLKIEFTFCYYQEYSFSKLRNISFLCFQQMQTLNLYENQRELNHGTSN